MAQRFQAIQAGLSQPHVAELVLARPDSQNALDVDMCAELVAGLTFAAETPEVRVVVLRGAGPVFSSGAEHRGAAPTDDGRTVIPVAEVLRTLHALPKPTIAVVAGRAHGSGLALALACDYVLCTEDAELAVPDIRFGLWGMHAMPYLIRALGPRIAFDLLATGRTIRGKAAEFAGMVTRAHAAGVLDDEAAELARRLAGLSPSALRIGKAAFRMVQGADGSDAHGYLQAQLDALLEAEDTREAADAVREGRQPVWKGR